MEIKAIVLDIDGTLLTTDRRITKRTREAIIEAQELGIKVILASGRSSNGLIPFAEELKIHNYGGLIVSNNGAVVVNGSNKTVYHNETVDIPAMKKLIQHLEQFDVHILLMDHNYLYTVNVENAVIQSEAHKFNVALAESEDCGLEIQELRHLNNFDIPVNKINIATNPPELLKIREEILAPIKNDISYSFTSPYFIEIMKKGIDKARGLDAALQELNLTNKQAIAFGDGENDLSLIRHAGIGVAMGNATENIKNHANFITHSNDEDGIVKVLEEKVFNKIK